MQPCGLISPSGCQTPVTGAVTLSLPSDRACVSCPSLPCQCSGPAALSWARTPGCCWSPPPTDCTYHRPEVRAPDCRRPRCHGAMVPLCCIVQGDFLNWSPLNFLCSKSLYNLQHLDKSGLVGMGSCTYKNWVGLV